METLPMESTPAGFSPVSEPVSEVALRAESVKQKLNNIKDQIETSFLDLCDLLREAQEGEYHIVWGYKHFGDWVEQGSDLDLSERQAFYYLNISKKAASLGLSRDDLKKIKISKLKEIFSLDDENAMRQLLEEAQTASLADVKTKVKKLKAPDPENAPSYVTLKLEALVKERFDKAVALARLNHGDTVKSNGEEGEISYSRAVEIICDNFLMDPNNYPEGVEMEANVVPIA